ncbi:unnamed protein product [Larinioides sclopetarius]|uniref:Thyroglobulin type-1 domain-containing protein n=1 Tax=Larinioides sclopetarius TaxID=280406 RepID=A0AAV2ATC8_9ARAC
MKCVILLAVLVAFVAVTQARPQSDCEKHRETAEKFGSIMKLIPKCKENGDYEELQCYHESKFCVCYDKKGHAASPISTKIKECGCYLRRKEKLDRNIDNAYIPQCAADGKWEPKQCWDYNDSCWCVDQQGERQGDIKAKGKGLNC